MRSLQYMRYIVQEARADPDHDPHYGDDADLGPADDDDGYDSDEAEMKELEDNLRPNPLSAVAQDAQLPDVVREAAAVEAIVEQQIQDQSQDVSMMEEDHPDVRWSGKGKYRRPVSEKQYTQLRQQRLEELRAASRAKVLRLLRERASDVSGLEREEPHIRWSGKGRRRRPVTDVDYERLRERRYRDLVKASRSSVVQAARRRNELHDYDDDEYADAYPMPGVLDEEEEKYPTDEDKEDDIETILRDKRQQQPPASPVFRVAADDDDLEAILRERRAQRGERRVPAFSVRGEEQKLDDGDPFSIVEPELDPIHVQRPRRRRDSKTDDDERDRASVRVRVDPELTAVLQSRSRRSARLPERRSKRRRSGEEDERDIRRLRVDPELTALIAQPRHSERLAQKSRVNYHESKLRSKGLTQRKVKRHRIVEPQQPVETEQMQLEPRRSNRRRRREEEVGDETRPRRSSRLAKKSRNKEEADE